MKRRVKNKTS